MMEQRRQGAQTAYMARMGERVGGQIGGEVGKQAGAAIGMGETQRQYVTAKDQLDTARTAREAALITAKSPEAVQTIRTGGEERIAEGVQTGLNTRQAADLEWEKTKYEGSGLHEDPDTGQRYIRNPDGSVRPMFDPGPTGEGYLTPYGDWKANAPRPAARDPFVVDLPGGKQTEHGYEQAPVIMIDGKPYRGDQAEVDAANAAAQEFFAGKNPTTEEYNREYARQMAIIAGREKTHVSKKTKPADLVGY